MSCVLFISLRRALLLPRNGSCWLHQQARVCLAVHSVVWEALRTQALGLGTEMCAWSERHPGIALNEMILAG